MQKRPANENAFVANHGALSKLFKKVAGTKFVRLFNEILSIPRHLRSVFNGGQTIQDLKKQSNTDFLTGLPNVRALNTGLPRMIESSIRNPKPDEPLLVVFCDLDGFKKINDTQGHINGDLALQDMAQLFKSFIRPRSTDLFARKGGDEFVYCGNGNSEIIQRNFQKLQYHLNERMGTETITGPNNINYEVKNYHRHGVSYGVVAMDAAFVSEHYGCQNFLEFQTRFSTGKIKIDDIVKKLIGESNKKMSINKASNKARKISQINSPRNESPERAAG